MGHINGCCEAHTTKNGLETEEIVNIPIRIVKAPNPLPPFSIDIKKQEIPLIEINYSKRPVLSIWASGGTIVCEPIPPTLPTPTVNNLKQTHLSYEQGSKLTTSQREIKEQAGIRRTGNQRL